MHYKAQQELAKYSTIIPLREKTLCKLKCVVFDMNEEEEESQ